jgi:hypothetical protein
MWGPDFSCFVYIYMLCQTTDSGSNNNTMAKTMHNKLIKVGGGTKFEWNCETMHIKCFCHKMALVVNAGLKELGLEAPPPPKIKKSFLGSFPYSNTMERIDEEEEEEEGEKLATKEFPIVTLRTILIVMILMKMRTTWRKTKIQILARNTKRTQLPKTKKNGDKQEFFKRAE